MGEPTVAKSFDEYIIDFQWEVKKKLDEFTGPLNRADNKLSMESTIRNLIYSWFPFEIARHLKFNLMCSKDKFDVEFSSDVPLSTLREIYAPWRGNINNGVVINDEVEGPELQPKYLLQGDEL